MDQGKKTGKGRKTVIAVFLLLIFLPGILYMAARVTKQPVDIPLDGYTPPEAPISLGVSAWLNGEMQQGLAARIETQIRPRGLMVKTYNTINFMLFRKSGRIIGKNFDIFEKEYVNAELILNSADDFSLEENIASMKEFASQLGAINRLLKQHGKTFLVCIAPSKGSADRENIPDRYLGMENKDGRRAVDLFREEIGKTDVPCLICADLAEGLKYPAFYSTGIHWSRTYEQTASRRMLEMIREESGTRYGKLLLTGVKESAEPYWRDADVLQLANVFYKPQITYYEYETEWEEDGEEDYPPQLRVLLQGDSFADGLKKDMAENIPGVQICQITNAYSAVDWDDRETLMHGDWGLLDWQYYLDNTDVVIVEIAEPFIKNRTYGFVDSLLARLESYVPAEGR